MLYESANRKDIDLFIHSHEFDSITNQIKNPEELVPLVEDDADVLEVDVDERRLFPDLLLPLLDSYLCTRFTVIAGNQGGDSLKHLYI